MRTLGIRDKQILLERAGYKCEACGIQLDFANMQVGHKIAYSKGGSASLKNSVCLCYKCNKLQGTDSWNSFLKKMGKEPAGSNVKEMLKKMTFLELKLLAKKHKVSVKGRVEEDLFTSRSIPPSKRQYINALSKLSEEDVHLFLKNLHPD